MAKFGFVQSGCSSCFDDNPPHLKLHIIHKTISDASASHIDEVAVQYPTSKESFTLPVDDIVGLLSGEWGDVDRVDEINIIKNINYIITEKNESSINKLFNYDNICENNNENIFINVDINISNQLSPRHTPSDPHPVNHGIYGQESLNTQIDELNGEINELKQENQQLYSNIKSNDPLSLLDASNTNTKILSTDLLQQNIVNYLPTTPSHKLIPTQSLAQLYTFYPCTRIMRSCGDIII